MNTETTRREMLKSVALGAGATLLTPILGQLAAHAASDEKTANCKRIVFVMQSNGINPNHLLPSGLEPPKWGPTNDTREEVSLKDRTLHPAIEPLAPFQDRLALVQGLSGRIALSDHSANLGALGCYSANRGAVAQTIDSALSEALPGTFSHVAIGYGGSTDSMNYN